MHLRGLFSNVCIGLSVHKHLSDAFLIHSGLEQADALFPFFSSSKICQDILTFSLEYTARKE
jgi:hypothetical protein